MRVCCMQLIKEDLKNANQETDCYCISAELSKKQLRNSETVDWELIFKGREIKQKLGIELPRLPLLPPRIYSFI